MGYLVPPYTSLIMGIDILGVDILGIDILGIDILAPTLQDKMIINMN